MRNDRRRDRRRNIRRNDEGEFSVKNLLYVSGIIIALGIIAFVITVMIYSHNTEKIYDDLKIEEIARVQADKEDIEETSSNLGKTIEEVKNEGEQKNEKVEEIVATPTATDKKEEQKTDVVTDKKDNQVAKQEHKKELSFAMPVKGEIIREFAKDNLVYSETLKEWVTHMGIDIKAEKTTVVKAAEEGTVTAIKNDPRYGTTVIISHEDGFETRYANLLTAEFVTVGEKVNKEQTIGTVGNTGAFEIMDDYHVHFEILKNGEYQDPNIYIN